MTSDQAETTSRRRDNIVIRHDVVLTLNCHNVGCVMLPAGLAFETITIFKWKYFDSEKVDETTCHEHFIILAFASNSFEMHCFQFHLRDLQRDNCNAL